MMTEEQKVTWLTSFSHLITHGFMTLLPALLVVITGEQSMSFLDIGIIANIGYFLYGLGSFPAGYLADRFGSKRLLTIGILGMSLSSLLVGISPGSLGFAVAYALLGTFASIHHPAGLSFIARRVEIKGRALGIHGVAGNIGLFLSPLAAGLCVLAFNTWRAAYIIFGIVGLFFLLIIQRTRISEEPDLVPGDFLRLPGMLFSGSGWRAKQSAAPSEAEEAVVPVALLLLFLGSILSGFIFRGSLTFFPALIQREVLFVANHDEPVVMAGFLTTAILSLGLVGAWFGGYINDKIKRPEFGPVLIFLVIAPTLYLISQWSDLKLIAIGSLFSLVYYAWQPAQNYLIAKYTKKSSHGKGFGVNFFLIFGIGSVATATGGYVTDDYGVDRFYLLMSIIAAAAFFAALGVSLVKRYQIRFSWRLVREKD